MNSNKEKLELAHTLITDSKKFKTKYTLECFYHDVPLRLEFSTKEWMNAIESFLPVSWKRSIPINCLTIQFVAPDSIGTINPSVSATWDDEADFEFHIHSVYSNEVAIQRDFLGIYTQTEKSVLCICNPGLSDGFYNSMRWILPRFMLKEKKLLVHSSCVVDRNSAHASLFLGPSNAGKSTIASLAAPRMVLGDDMNVVSIREGAIYTEAGGFGQDPQFQGPLGKIFPLSGIYWIQKNRANKLSALHKVTATVKFLSCIMSYADTIHFNRNQEHVFQIVEKILEIHSMDQLDFQLDNSIWQTLESINHKTLD